MERNGSSTYHGFTGRFVTRQVVGVVEVGVVHELGTQRTSYIEACSIRNLRVLNVRGGPHGFVTMFVGPRGRTSTRVICTTLRYTIRDLNIVDMVVLKTYKIRVFVTFFVVYFLRGSVYTSSNFFGLSMIFGHNNNGVGVRTTSDTIFVLGQVGHFGTVGSVFSKIISEILTHFSYGTLIPRVLGHSGFLFGLVLDRLFSNSVLIFLIV